MAKNLRTNQADPKIMVLIKRIKRTQYEPVNLASYLQLLLNGLELGFKRAFDVEEVVLLGMQQVVRAILRAFPLRP